MHLLFTLPNLHEREGHRGKARTATSSRGDSQFWKVDGFGWTGEAGLETRSSPGRLTSPNTGQVLVTSGLGGQTPHHELPTKPASCVEPPASWPRGRGGAACSTRSAVGSEGALTRLLLDVGRGMNRQERSTNSKKERAKGRTSPEETDT